MNVEKRCRINMEYAVKLEYEGLSIDELSKILDIVMMNQINWEYLLDPVIKRDYRSFDDGWEEPLDTWNITVSIDSCGGIDLDSYNKYYSSSVTEGFGRAEKLAAEINKALGID